MSFNFDNAKDRRNTDSVKWDENAIESICSNRNAEPFWVADMDFESDEHIKTAALKEAEFAVFAYPKEDNITASFASWALKRHSWKIDEEKTVFVNGLLHGIGLAIDLFTKEGDKILIPSPTYRPFREMCADSFRVMLDLPLDKNSDGTFSFNIDAFKEKAKEASMILFCSPHNPSGIVFGECELEEVLKCAKELNIPVVSDEIHADLCHSKKTHIPMGKANEKIGADVITLMAPSKTFNLAGEHASFAVFSNDEMLETYKRKQRALRVTSPGYTIKRLLKTAYDYGYDYNKALCEYLEKTVDEIKAYLKDNINDVKLSNADASFVAFLDFSAYYDRIEQKVKENPEHYKLAAGGGVLSTFFGVDASVCMNDGTWFGPEYKQYVRLNYGTSRERVLSALKRIASAVKAL